MNRFVASQHDSSPRKSRSKRWNDTYNITAMIKANATSKDILLSVHGLSESVTKDDVIILVIDSENLDKTDMESLNSEYRSDNTSASTNEETKYDSEQEPVVLA
ncbi:unnamed protein product [Parnassius apollo]|uniref:(apollo) hypothetical protein n=1 Tax=Parnassius apollo TaxID=110799 RepID=A0A8S3WCD4_PARAO|nr:unnamed protein product [Parnassius apollo]